MTHRRLCCRGHPCNDDRCKQVGNFINDRFCEWSFLDKKIMRQEYGGKSSYRKFSCYCYQEKQDRKNIPFPALLNSVFQISKERRKCKRGCYKIFPARYPCYCFHVHRMCDKKNSCCY